MVADVSVCLRKFHRSAYKILPLPCRPQRTRRSPRSLQRRLGLPGRRPEASQGLLLEALIDPRSSSLLLLLSSAALDGATPPGRSFHVGTADPLGGPPFSVPPSSTPSLLPSFAFPSPISSPHPRFAIVLQRRHPELWTLLETRVPAIWWEDVLQLTAAPDDQCRQRHVIVFSTTALS